MIFGKDSSRAEGNKPPMMQTMDRDRTDSGPNPNQMRAATGPDPDRIRVDGETYEVRITLPTLSPRSPPGRSNRKGRAFEPQIAQLRAQGYTLTAIRDALADAGVHVSKSTVQREAARRATVPKAQEHVALLSRRVNSCTPAPVPRPDATSDTPASSSSSPDRRSGKEIAAEFMRNRITNPLFRNKR